MRLRDTYLRARYRLSKLEGSFNGTSLKPL